MALEGDKRKYKLSIYLMKKDVTDFTSSLKTRVRVTEYPIKGSLKVEGAIFIGDTRKNEFAWQALLQQGTDKSIPKMTNASNRAVVFFKVQNRIYALPFGFGKHLLNEEAIEREFGLRTALNLIDPDKLRSIDKANLDDLALMTRTQMSRRASPQEFNLDIVRDLMRGVTGEPINGYENFGSTVTGSEGLYMIPAVSFEDIPEFLNRVRTAYRSKAYKGRFDWIDNLKYERDPIIIEKLQDRLLAALSAKSEEGIHLFPPVIIDWTTFEGISFTPKGTVYTELDISAFYKARADELIDLDWEKLKKLRVFVKYSNQNEPIPVTLFNSLSYQVKHENYVYVLAFSQWYRISRLFSNKIVEHINSIPESSLEFMDCDPNFNEEDYNKAFAATSVNYKLFDQVFIKSDAIRSKVELCDILAVNEREFIHVKFKDSSSVLSHLFAQGKISANLIARDSVFRRNVREKFKMLKIPAKIIPEGQDRLDCSQYTVTFAIIGNPLKSFIQLLPFFSQLNLMLTTQELRLLGFKVKIKKINLLPV